MKRSFIFVIAVLVVFGSVFAWTVKAGKKADPAEVKTVATDNNAFAVDLYGQVAKGQGNIIFSPYSVVSAFGMVYAGARGETEAEMAKAMHFSLGQEKLHSALGTLTNDLNARGKGGKYELTVANKLWPHKSYKFLDSYLGLVKDNYGATLETVDYSNPEAARKIINTWVEDNTNKKIKDLIPEKVLDPLTRMVLTNAVYFKGMWESAFKKSNTSDADFTLASGEKAKVPTMFQKAMFGYGENDTLQVLEMDYKGGELSMVILLPQEVNGLSELEKDLSADKLAKLIAAISKDEVMVYLPRFKMEYNLNLVPGLQALGMDKAFIQGQADFSGMDGTQDLYISAAIHKAFIEVNEEGTEAAAATAVVISTKSIPIPSPTFRADHPFLFLIRDKATGAILFFGWVADPR